jgi:hypothetical protein
MSITCFAASSDLVQARTTLLHFPVQSQRHRDKDGEVELPFSIAHSPCAALCSFDLLYLPSPRGGARESRASPSLAAMPGRSWPKKSQKSQGGLVQCMTQPHKKGSPRRVLSSRHPQKVKPTQQIERRGGREEFFHTLCPPQSWWGIESWGVVCPMATMAAHAHSPVQPRTLPLY